ncbi:ECF transporter S component [Chloroflexus sp.]|uniref:ECF transporter S component n=1 Tax=Chloroflexus sp. TaxID=1904827 RepID=UPI002624F6AC|nr:ECF transporter S component [uncultured Chloroflexus sp.]
MNTSPSHHNQPAAWAGNLALALICLLGAIAFLYPFAMGRAETGFEQAHATTAPIFFAILGPALLILLIAELSAGRLNTRALATLGVLAGVVALLRLPAGPGDSPTFFFLIILAGYVYGARFGFLLGALGLLVSALLTGGIGPWLPFQMFVSGWMGMSAGLLTPLGRSLKPGGWGELTMLAGFGYLWGFLFGALMNLWFWPFAPAGSLGWTPGSGLTATIQQYFIFYTVTSLAWDATRALGNALLIALLGRLALKELRRFRNRFWFAVDAH